MAVLNVGPSHLQANFVIIVISPTGKLTYYFCLFSTEEVFIKTSISLIPGTPDMILLILKPIMQ